MCMAQQLHFAFSTGQIYLLITGKRAGVLAVPQVSLLVPGSVLWWREIRGVARRRGPACGRACCRCSPGLAVVAQRASCSRPRPALPVSCLALRHLCLARTCASGFWRGSETHPAEGENSSQKPPESLKIAS